MLKAGVHRGFLRFRVCRYCKNLEIFMTCVLLYLQVKKGTKETNTKIINLKKAGVASRNIVLIIRRISLAVVLDLISF